MSPCEPARPTCSLRAPGFAIAGTSLHQTPDPLGDAPVRRSVGYASANKLNLESVSAGMARTSYPAARIASKSEWACLPAGPLERHVMEGGPEGVKRRGPLPDLQKGLATFNGRVIIRGSLCLLISRMLLSRKGCRALCKTSSRSGFHAQPPMRTSPTPSRSTACAPANLPWQDH